MSSIAEMLIPQAAQAQSAPDISGAINQGAQLAQHINQTQIQRAQLELNKQELELKKDDELAKSFEIIGKIKSPTMRKIYVEKVLSNKLKMLKREDMFAPGVYEAVQKGDQESINRVLNGIKDVREGRMTYDQFRATLKNEDDFVTLESYEPEFLKAQESGRDYQERLNVARITANRQTDQFNKGQLQKIKDDFDSAVKPLREGLVAVDNATKLVQSGGPIAAEVAKVQLARLSGEKGPLNEADIGRFGGSRDLLSRANSLMTKLTTGKLTPETREEYNKIITEFGNVMRAKVRDEESRQIMSAEGFGLDGNQTRKVLAADSIVKETSPTAKISDEQILKGLATSDQWTDAELEEVSHTTGRTVKQLKALLSKSKGGKK